ncbi:hypothetical protein L3Q65_00710 (plasmid) [Amycolatopsis sp. FU40]|uniref:hypothetical protein n=1 Tax=Amycolatopsis sp. FU40 TaxID=2914159 RepID=UPI001F297BB2|nr:hypothetical protein [Amycolatopsis sp. FU40]UKD50848.1 hypothetical protein L3Q65_00710 [Amycolatopsis sp. FU40]
MFTDADRYETYTDYGDATFIHRADRFDDVLAAPPGSQPDPLERDAFRPHEIPLSDKPALELPHRDPTVADLKAIEAGAAEADLADRIAEANAQSARLAAHDDLQRLREQLPVSAREGLPDETDLGRAA